MTASPWNWPNKVALVAGALAAVVLAATAVWIALLEPDDWDVLVPLYTMLLVGSPLGGVGLVAAACGARAGHRRRAGWLAAANLALLAGPWAWFGLVT